MVQRQAVTCSQNVIRRLVRHLDFAFGINDQETEGSLVQGIPYILSDFTFAFTMEPELDHAS